MKKTYLKILQLLTKQVNFANTNKHWHKHIGKKTTYSTLYKCVLCGWYRTSCRKTCFKYILCFNSHCRWNLNCKPSSAGGIKAVCLMDPNWSNCTTFTQLQSKKNDQSWKEKSFEFWQAHHNFRISLPHGPQRICQPAHEVQMMLDCYHVSSCERHCGNCYVILGLKAAHPAGPANCPWMKRAKMNWMLSENKDLSEWVVYSKKHSGVIARVETIGHFELATFGNINLLHTIHLTQKWGRYWTN